MKYMKIWNGLTWLLFVSVFFTACAGSKEARTLKKTIKGDWTIKTINIEGNNSIVNTRVFNEAENNCFIGSTWNFVSNNGTGSYTLPSGTAGCAALTRKIRWSIYEPDGEEKKFQFKRLDDKNDPLDDNNGYRLNVASLTETTMQLKSTITYNNEPVNMVYNFVKNQIKKNNL